jgi:CelD/BcsL family acetyltransferase involved in cellulose biosynthesis
MSEALTLADMSVSPAIALQHASDLREVYEIDPIHDPRWTALVDSHPRSSTFHTANWLRALLAVYGYEPVVLTTCPPRARLTNGLVFCRVSSWLTGRRLVSLPFSDHCDPLVDRSDEFDEILLQLRRSVDNGKWKYLEIRPISCRYSDRADLSKGIRYKLHRVDLRRSLQDLYHNFHKDCVQRKIRRAERESLQYEEGASEELLHKFYRLLVMTRRRQYLPPQPLDWFRVLISSFGAALKIRVASKDGKPIASILTLSHKKVMTYKYGCSDSAFNNLGGMALLFWKLVQDSRQQGLEELDLGRSDIDNDGLITFKEHWGATGTDIQYLSYPAEPPGLPSAWKTKWARYVVSMMPDPALEAIGQLAYRHIG